MPSARLAAMLAALAVLSLSCGDDDHDATRDRCNPALHREAFERCVETRDQTACEAAGGTWGNTPAELEPRCLCPTGQDGCACSDASRCLGDCVGPRSSGIEECPGVTAGTCQATVPAVACECIARPDGSFAGRCP